MTATTEILIVCNGIDAKGCTFGSELRIPTDYRATARRAAAAYGWTYARRMNQSNNVVQHIDICYRCSGTAQLMKTKEEK